MNAFSAPDVCACWVCSLSVTFSLSATPSSLYKQAGDFFLFCSIGWGGHLVTTMLVQVWFYMLIKCSCGVCRDTKGDYFPLVEMKSHDDCLVRSLHRVTKVASSTVTFQESNWALAFLALALAEDNSATPQPAAMSAAYKTMAQFSFQIYLL